MARDYDDDRVVITGRDSGSGVGMLLLGLVIGAGAALLFATAGGRETRERFAREARRAGRRVKDMTVGPGDHLADRMARTHSAGDDRVGRAKDAEFGRVEAVHDEAHAARDHTRDARDEIERAVQHRKRAYADGRRAYLDRTTRGGEPSPTADDLAHRQGAERNADGFASGV